MDNLRTIRVCRPSEAHWTLDFEGDISIIFESKKFRNIIASNPALEELAVGDAVEIDYGNINFGSGFGDYHRPEPFCAVDVNGNTVDFLL